MIWGEKKTVFDLERFAHPFRNLVWRKKFYKQDIQDNRSNNHFSTLERAHEIEVPFILKRVQSPELQFNENSYEKLISFLDENITSGPRNVVQPHYIEIIIKHHSRTVLKLLQ